MITFKEIFQRAVHLFDDPEINYAYVNDPVKFNQIMRPYLISGLGRFSTPLIVAQGLYPYTDAQGSEEIITGENTNKYTLETHPTSNADFTFKIGKNIDSEAVYDAKTNTVTFSRIITPLEECSVSWYDAGQFAFNVNNIGLAPKISTASVEEQVKKILAHCLCVAVAEQEKNFILDLKNVLTDTDFKLHSPAQNILAKNNWFRGVEDTLYALMTQLGWMLTSSQQFGPRAGKGWH